MQKIKVRPQEKRIVAREFNPIEFFSMNRTRIIRSGMFIIVVILCCLSFWRWQENKRANFPIVLNQARELFYNGKYEAALSLYKQYPESPMALLGVAYCYEELGDVIEAKKAYQKITDPPWRDEAVKGLERLR